MCTSTLGQDQRGTVKVLVSMDYHCIAHDSIFDAIYSHNSRVQNRWPKAMTLSLDVVASLTSMAWDGF
jgi:hypothetical protein